MQCMIPGNACNQIAVITCSSLWILIYYIGTVIPELVEQYYPKNLKQQNFNFCIVLNGQNNNEGKQSKIMIFFKCSGKLVHIQ